jgi:hypothetical protein
LWRDKTRHVSDIGRNCHLIDQHNPTSPVHPKKLEMFRRFKDPAILKSQFHSGFPAIAIP